MVSMCNIVQSTTFSHSALERTHTQTHTVDSHVLEWLRLRLNTSQTQQIYAQKLTEHPRDEGKRFEREQQKKHTDEEELGRKKCVWNASEIGCKIFILLLCFGMHCTARASRWSCSWWFTRVRYATDAVVCAQWFRICSSLEQSTLTRSRAVRFARATRFTCVGDVQVNLFRLKCR